MTKDDVFGARRRVKSAKAAVRRNEELKHAGDAYDELLAFFEDLMGALANQRPDARADALHYVARTMGVVVKRHANAAYKPHGFRNPFLTAVQATKSKPPVEKQKAPLWIYPVVHMPPSAGTGPFSADFRDFSALKMFGYTVGKTDGWGRAERQAFLTDFMEMKLPPIVVATFSDEYGGPCTSDRLRKVANVLANNASNFYRNDPLKYEVAIGHWEDDLQFLRERYYDRMGLKFMPWPSSRSR